MYHQENKTFSNYENYLDYESLYSRNSIYSFDKNFFNDDDSIFTRHEMDEMDEMDDIDEIINSYAKNEEYATVNLIDIRPLDFQNDENDDNIYIIKGGPIDEKYFTLPLTEEQYYALKQRWNQQLDEEIEKVKGARVINHLSMTNSDYSVDSVNSCPELSASSSEMSNSLKSRFYDDEDENKTKKFKSWKKWFSKKSKNPKIKTNFYDSLVKNQLTI